MFFDLFGTPRPPAWLRKQAPPGKEYVPYKNEPGAYILREEQHRSMLLQVAWVIGGLILVGLALIALGATAAKAQSIPRYDVDRFCGDFEGQPARNYCVNLEQRSYGYVNHVWMQLSPHSRQYCSSPAVLGQGASRYSRMAYCVSAHLYQERMSRPTRFQQ